MVVLAWIIILSTHTLHPMKLDICTLKVPGEKICGINRKCSTIVKMSQLLEVLCNSYSQKGPNEVYHLVNVITVYTEWNGINKWSLCIF